MARINEGFLNLQSSYLFAEVKRRAQAHRDAHPDARLIDLGIGDVTLPLPPAVVEALEAAAREQGRAETLRGYGPYVGYDFLRAAIAAHDFGARGVKVAADEIFVSDGGKSDAANIQELFAQDAVVALMDPAYPVYADANVMAGRSGPADSTGRYADFVYLPCTAENDFQPALPDRHVDLIYLCYPNNPTGAVMTREALRRWVDYARAHEAVIVYDAAYEAYIRDPEIPAVDLRGRGRARGGHRVAELLEERRLHGPAHGLHGGAARAGGAHRRRPRREPAPALAPPAVDEVERPALRDPARRRRRLHARGPGAGARADRPLHGERARHPRGPGRPPASPCTAGATRPTSGSARRPACRRGTSSTGSSPRPT